MNALNVLCAQLTRDLFAIAKFLLIIFPTSALITDMLITGINKSCHAQQTLPCAPVHTAGWCHLSLF